MILRAVPARRNAKSRRACFWMTTVACCMSRRGLRVALSHRELPPAEFARTSRGTKRPKNYAALRRETRRLVAKRWGFN